MRRSRAAGWKRRTPQRSESQESTCRSFGVTTGRQLRGFLSGVILWNARPCLAHPWRMIRDGWKYMRVRSPRGLVAWQKDQSSEGRTQRRVRYETWPLSSVFPISRRQEGEKPCRCRGPDVEYPASPLRRSNNRATERSCHVGMNLIKVTSRLLAVFGRSTVRKGELWPGQTLERDQA